MDHSSHNQPASAPKTIASKPIYQNPWLHLREDSVLRPDGSRGTYGIITMRTGATVLALDDQQRVYMVREYKYGIRRESLELVSGGINEGEQPLAAAQRELQEEAGIRARTWIDLGWIDPFTTIVDSRNHLFVAHGIEPGQQHLDEGEALRVELVPFKKAVEMVMASHITHGASCALILKTIHLLSTGELKIS